MFIAKISRLFHGFISSPGRRPNRKIVAVIGSFSVAFLLRFFCCFSVVCRLFVSGVGRALPFLVLSNFSKFNKTVNFFPDVFCHGRADGLAIGGGEMALSTDKRKNAVPGVLFVYTVFIIPCRFLAFFSGCRLSSFPGWAA